MDRAIELILEIDTIKSMAKTLGVKEGTVRDLLKECGVDLISEIEDDRNLQT